MKYEKHVEEKRACFCNGKQNSKILQTWSSWLLYCVPYLRITLGHCARHSHHTIISFILGKCATDEAVLMCEWIEKRRILEYFDWFTVICIRGLCIFTQRIMGWCLMLSLCPLYTWSNRDSSKLYTLIKIDVLIAQLPCLSACQPIQLLFFGSLWILNRLSKLINKPSLIFSL